MNNFIKYVFTFLMLGNIVAHATPAEEIPAININLASDLTSQAHGMLLPYGGLGLCCALDCANDCAERALEKTLHKTGLSMKQRVVRQALSTFAHGFAYAFTTELVTTCLPAEMPLRCNLTMSGSHGPRYYSDVYDTKPVIVATMPTLCALIARLVTRKIATLAMQSRDASTRGDYYFTDDSE